MTKKFDAVGDRTCNRCRFWHNPAGLERGMCIVDRPYGHPVPMVLGNHAVIDPNKPPQVGILYSAVWPQPTGDQGCDKHQIRKNDLQ